MRYGRWITLLALFAATPFGAGSPATPTEKKAIPSRPLSPYYFSLMCNANERTCVIAHGSGRTPVGLYIYDAHGNCITRDEPVLSGGYAVVSGDLEGPVAADDLQVEWFPPTSGYYTVEVRNEGLQPTRLILAFQ
jgi:hypothetical protein